VLAILFILTNMILALIAGDLPRRRRTNTSLRKTLTIFDTHDEYPGIYANWFVDKDGYPPTVMHMNKLIEGVKRYTKDHSFAAAVDRQFVTRTNNQWAGRDGTGLDKTLRRYLGGTYPGNDRYERKERRLEAFAEKWKNILNGMKPNEHIPRAIIEVGWGSDCRARKEAHKKHYSSNYLMNLFDATSRCLGLGYSIENHVIYNVWESAQAGPAEAAFTEISMGIVEDGFGFSYWPPGQNVAGSLDLAAKSYMYVQRNIVQYGPLYQNLQEERRRWDEAVKKYKILHPDLKRIQADVKRIESKLREVHIKKFHGLQKMDSLLDERLEPLLSVRQNEPFRSTPVFENVGNDDQDTIVRIEETEEYEDSGDFDESDDTSSTDDSDESEIIEISDDDDGEYVLAG
jgi:hypothetical protein